MREHGNDVSDIDGNDVFNLPERRAPVVTISADHPYMTTTHAESHKIRLARTISETDENDASESDENHV